MSQSALDARLTFGQVYDEDDEGTGCAVFRAVMWRDAASLTSFPLLLAHACRDGDP